MPEKSPCETVRSPASRFGQLIGNVFETIVIDLIRDYLDSNFPDFEIQRPKGERSQVTLKMPGGLPRRMDNVIVMRKSEDPLALMETKWLKDTRHHNDKGAWILQLREMRKSYPTIRGAAAVVAGYWPEGVGLMLEGEGGIRMVLVATDEEVYSTLQGPLNDLFGPESFNLDASEMRKSYPEPIKLCKLAMHLEQSGQIFDIASKWLSFQREVSEQGNVLTGTDLIHNAIYELLKPLPISPAIQSFQIALNIETGNTIYEEFTDMEELYHFIETYVGNPEAILRKISPRKRQEPDDME